MKLHCYFPLLLLWAIGCSPRIDPNAEALEALDRILDQRALYASAKQARIGEQLRLSSRTQQPLLQIDIAERLYKEYYNYDIDSAYHYARRMLELAEARHAVPRIHRARLYLAKTVFDGGMYGEATRILRQVDTACLQREQMSEYYSVCISFLSKQLTVCDPALKPLYEDSVARCNRLRIDVLPEGSITRKRLVAMTCNTAGAPEKALALLLPVYEAGIDDIHQRAIVAYALSQIYEKLGDADRRKACLIRAAADDLRTPVREGMALYTLAGLLFEEGDVARANRYINRSMEDALYCNFRARMQQSSEMVRRIGGAYIQSIDDQRRAMSRAILIVSLLLLFLLGSLFTILVYYRKIRHISANRLEMNQQLQQLNRSVEQRNERIRRINGELRDANNIKDEYVGHYLNLCSQYILKLNVYRKHLLKVSKEGGLAALLGELRAKNPSDAEYKEFLAIFDETFLHLFPDFVEQVNELRIEEARFVLQHPGTLNTELRILALMRLGVTNSTKIAAILNCAVATIHTYRAQLRNGALGDRSAFDDAIRRIGIP